MKYLGTDGFRGEANVGLTVEHAYKIGRFVGWYYGANRERKAATSVEAPCKKLMISPSVARKLTSAVRSYRLRLMMSMTTWATGDISRTAFSSSFSASMFVMSARS